MPKKVGHTVCVSTRRKRLCRKGLRQKRRADVVVSPYVSRVYVDPSLGMVCRCIVAPPCWGSISPHRPYPSIGGLFYLRDECSATPAR
jgi:hypothetical protein